MRAESPQLLTRLLRAMSDARVPDAATALSVRRVIADARLAEPGDLFVAVPGHQTDGHQFAAEAVRRGAVAVVAERELDPSLGAPVILVPDARRALAQLAAAWHGRPTQRLDLVGITGSFGKTGTLNMLQAILLHGGIRAGVIGSDFIGLRLPGRLHEPGELTTPDPLALHEALARIVENDGELCAMEVTSQGLVQERVCGLDFALGIFTALAPLEHGDYHRSFRNYVEAKARFFDHLLPGAPLVYPADDRVVRGLVSGRDVAQISCGMTPSADVHIRDTAIETDRVRMLLVVQNPLRSIAGDEIPPVEIPIEIPLLGRMNIRNAALAAAAALCCGATPDDVRTGLASIQPPPRRLQVTRLGGFQLLDDTATHPESLSVAFEVIETIPHRRLHLITAIRGGRGTELNRRYGETLGIWARRNRISTLIATDSEEIVEEADRVRSAERYAFIDALRAAGVEAEHVMRLDTAVQSALDAVSEGDLLVLLGAQGMHAGAALARDRVEGRDVDDADTERHDLNAKTPAPAYRGTTGV